MVILTSHTTIVKEFDIDTLLEIKAKGYRYLLYQKKQDYALITPLFEECETNDASYILPIEDEQAMEMAYGVDDYRFYLHTPEAQDN